MSERQHELQALAPILNRLPADPNARVGYELMSDALVWSDELPPDPEPHGDGWVSLRGVFRYRTTLILGKPEEKYRAGWEVLASLCPNWPGLLPERRIPDPRHVQLFEEASARLLAEWEALDARFEAHQGDAAAARTTKAIET